jgi:hypothetical protein
VPAHCRILDPEFGDSTIGKGTVSAVPQSRL